VIAVLMSATDNAQQFSEVVRSKPSSGNGVEETIEYLDTAIVTEPATQYYVVLRNSSGGLDSEVYRLEVDISP
jgi:hypothetical protein